MEAVPTTFRIESRDSIEFNLSEVMLNGNLTIYKEVEDLGLLFLRFQRQKVIVSAGGYIGLIPLTPSISIEVIPKLPVRNLARVLDVARSSLRSLQSTDRAYKVEIGSSISILEFLVVNLVDAVSNFEIYGLHKEYQSKHTVGSHPSGRIDISESLQKFWSRGQRHLVGAARFEQTSNNSINRVVKAGLRFALERLNPESLESRQLVKRVNNAYGRMPTLVDELGAHDIQSTKALLARKGLPLQRDYYYRALEISLLILEGNGIALQRAGSDITLRSFIVNFDDLFETYIRRVLQLRSTKEVRVLDGNHEGKRPLFQDKKNPPAQPDIVVRSSFDGSCIVADVKYKDAPKRDDINQAVAYAVCYSTKRTLIIHQVKPGALLGLSHLGTVGNISVDVYAFNLDSDQLHRDEDDLAKAVLALAG